ncbi:MAG: FimB/Mfa2 family fimbrial subunit [Tannerellaceae bacterium]|jgi:hypothetical protein|nr:FimB/Mfa2 family fimbrial subunit [Tannerellaceae bacterium]
MELKNLFMYAATATTVLLGCSENKPILNEEEEPATPATLSIRIDADGTIISKAATDQTVANMYVLIFDSDGTYYKAEALGTGDTGSEGEAENVEIEVKEGAHKVLVIANFKGDASAFAGKSLSQVQAMTTKLDAEADGNLTMSSEVMNVSFLRAATNKIGYDVIATDGSEVYTTPAIREPVKLYRSVARVQLSQLILGKSVDEAAYGTPVAFFMDSMFIANGKGYSQLASASNTTLSIEAGTAPDEKLWWYGRWTDFNEKDVLKKIPLANTYEWIDGLSYGSPFIEGTTTPRIQVNPIQPMLPPVVGNPATPISVDDGNIVSKYFYVYENEDAEPGYQTLLVLKGTYMYDRKNPIYEDDDPCSEENCNERWLSHNRYYAIPINPAGMDATEANGLLRDHTGIIRNTIYDLRVTITGPGSTYPYQPEAHLYYNAEVVVADWTRVNIGTPTDPVEAN